MNKKIIITVVILAAAVLIISAGVYVENSVSINTNSAPAASPPQALQNTTALNASSNPPPGTSVKIALGDYGQAPDFTGATNWLNSPLLTIAGLKGKVVLVDFWTYSCINCIRTLPYVTKLYDMYRDKGLVVVGVHAPEFAFEKDTNNVKNAIAQYGIHYPVAQDNNLAIWQAYNNEYWPAEYLINQKGEIVEEHFGEGDYDKTEADIRQLLGITSGSEMPVTNDNLDKIQSPEMYFGTDRMQYLSSEQTTTGNNPSLSAQNYVLVQNPDLNSYSLGGTWKSSNQSIQLIGSTGQINLKFKGDC